MPMTEQPKCRCAERRDAMKRMREAAASGDLVGAAKEWEFMKRTALEDTIAMRDWVMANAQQSIGW
jgi:hypothetical protein